MFVPFLETLPTSPAANAAVRLTGPPVMHDIFGMSCPIFRPPRGPSLFRSINSHHEIGQPSHPGTYLAIHLDGCCLLVLLFGCLVMMRIKLTRTFFPLRLDPWVYNFSSPHKIKVRSRYRLNSNHELMPEFYFDEAALGGWAASFHLLRSAVSL